MKENQPILTVENYKFSIFDSVPKPTADIAYILYREGRTIDNLLLITSQHPVLSSQIRSGKFNKKVTVSLAWREFDLTKEIADESGNYRFIVEIGIKYRIKDAVYVFQNNLTNIDSLINNKTYDIIQPFCKQYDFESQLDLEGALRKYAEKQFNLMHYLEIAEITINVDVDEQAKKIIDSNLNTMANSVLMQNQGDIESLKVEQNKRIKIQELEAEKEIAEKKIALDLVKARGMNVIEEEIGDDLGIYLAYINGEINSVEFDERMRNSKNSAMLSNLSTLRQLVELDVLSGQALEKAVIKLLGESENEIEQKVLVQNIEEENEIIIEDTEEY